MFAQPSSRLTRTIRRGWVGAAACTAVAAGIWGAASVARAAPPDTMPIWRLQVRFLTASVGDAGTDDSVMIELRGGNRTWLDSGRDDHEGGSSETFDLRTDGINTLADIDFFRIEKTGSDGWAIRNMQLLVNGRIIFNQQFSGDPLWLDNEDGHSRVFLMDDSFMRPRSEWVNYGVPTRPNVVPVGDMERRIEALVGDWKHDHSGTNFIGGNDGVEMFAFSTNTWRVDLDLEDEKQWPFPDLEFDVDFDLTVSCASGRPRFTVANINTDASWPEDDGGSVSFVGNSLAPRLEDMMKNFRFVPLCPSIVLASNGDLHFNPRIPPIRDYALLEFADTLAPIALHVTTGGETKPDGKGRFVATTRSILKQDSTVEVSFELPPQIALAEDVVEVQGEKESYKVEVKPEQRDDGSSFVAFKDVLRSGGLVRYALALVYKAGKDETALVKTVIKPLDDDSVTALEAVSAFQLKSDLVVPLGTYTHNAQYVEELPKEATVKR